MDQILEIIYQYYPKEIDSADSEYDNTNEAKLLVAKMEAAKSDDRREAFVSCLQKALPAASIYDRTYFCFAKPCFHFIVYFYCVDTIYEIMIYISFICPFWGYAINTHSISGEKELNEIAEAYMDQLLKMSRIERDKFIDDLKVEYFQNNPTKIRRSFLLEYDEHVSTAMEKIINCQNKIFNYEILPKNVADFIVPGVATNQMPFGKATVFDCLFTDTKQ